MLKKKDLVAAVMAKTGLKRRQAVQGIDAAFAVMREKLAAGEDLHVPPLGKVKVKTRGEGDEAKTGYRLILASDEEVAAEAAAAAQETEEKV